MHPVGGLAKDLGDLGAVAQWDQAEIDATKPMLDFICMHDFVCPGWQGKKCYICMSQKSYSRQYRR